MPLPAITYTRSDRLYSKPRLQRVNEVLMYAFLGWKQKDICERLGYTPSRVSLIINSDYGQEYLTSLRREQEISAVDVKGRLTEQFIKHLDLPDEILTSDEVPMNQKWKTFVDLGEMVGFGKQTKISIDSSREVTENALLAIKQRAEEKYANQIRSQAEEVEVEGEEELIGVELEVITEEDDLSE